LPGHLRLRREQRKPRKRDGPSENRKNKTKDATDKRAFKIRTCKTSNSRKLDARTMLQQLKKSVRELARISIWKSGTSPRQKDTSSMRPSVTILCLNGGKKTALPDGGRLPMDGTRPSEKRAYQGHLERLKLWQSVPTQNRIMCNHTASTKLCWQSDTLTKTQKRKKKY